MMGMTQTPDVQKSMQQKPLSEVLKQAKEKLVQIGVPEAQAEAMARQMTFGAMVAQTIVNAGLLVNRLREDSNELQKFPGGPIGAIKYELELMNRALAAVPAMPTEMNIMNRHMSVMAYGMGSTMGRVGNVMPW
jgi:hypothetical protein